MKRGLPGKAARVDGRKNPKSHPTEIQLALAEVFEEQDR